MIVKNIKHPRVCFGNINIFYSKDTFLRESACNSRWFSQWTTVLSTFIIKSGSLTSAWKMKLKLNIIVTTLNKKSLLVIRFNLNNITHHYENASHYRPCITSFSTLYSHLSLAVSVVDMKHVFVFQKSFNIWLLLTYWQSKDVMEVRVRQRASQLTLV